MKYYLSSFKIGNKARELQKLFVNNKKVGYVPNALDFTKANSHLRKEHIDADVASLVELGLDVETIDLRSYFGKKQELQKKIDELGGLWVSGGNVFVLRQAMKLSCLDEILISLTKRDDFAYGGYSAAGCVLSKKLDAYQIVDDATDTPYPELKEVLWDGIGLLKYAFLPHYNSDHPESSDIDKEIKYCKDNKIPYKTLRDGEVLLIQ